MCASGQSTPCLAETISTSMPHGLLPIRSWVCAQCANQRATPTPAPAPRCPRCPHVQAGLAMLPDSVYLHIVYSNFLIEVRGNNQSGWAQLEQARKLEPNLSFQFSIFTREQEHKQRSANLGSGGGEAVDLVSYVEMQRSSK